jgi:hypothetical protein
LSLHQSGEEWHLLHCEPIPVSGLSHCQIDSNHVAGWSNRESNHVAGWSNRESNHVAGWNPKGDSKKVPCADFPPRHSPQIVYVSQERDFCTFSVLFMPKDLKPLSVGEFSPPNFQRMPDRSTWLQCARNRGLLILFSSVAMRNEITICCFLRLPPSSTCDNCCLDINGCSALLLCADKRFLAGWLKIAKEKDGIVSLATGQSTVSSS